jgi:hypothetical protein
MAKVMFVRPPAQDRVVIAAEATKGSDTSLPAGDRRSRARISPTTNIAAGTTVYDSTRSEYEVLGPARGEGWALLAWVETDGSRCFGTFHETQFSTTQPQAR